tara:strand:- start:8143 stop:9531 length:1389 start_codon:yes stop_codon:yes gene_type:complete
MFNKKHKKMAKIIAVVIIIISLSLFAYFIITNIIDKKTSGDVSSDDESDGKCDIEDVKCIKNEETNDNGVPFIDKRQYDSDKKSTILIQNKTNEEYLHVFITSLITTDDVNASDYKSPKYKMKNYKWKKVEVNGGNGIVYPPINWMAKHGDKDISFDPLGSQVASEIIIPKGDYILLDNPIKKGFIGVKGNTISQFKIIPVKFDRKNTPMKPEDPLIDPLEEGNINMDWINGGAGYVKTHTGLLNQQAILIEAGEEAVADASAVDGLNYRIKYSLTTNDKTKNDVIQKTTLNTNPCEGLDDKYKIDPQQPNHEFNTLEVGCYNPYKIDCAFPNDTTPKINDTAYCIDNTQECCFNKCSQKLFNIPNNLNKYKCNKYPDPKTDGGKGPDGKNTPIVKKWINNENNINNNEGCALKKYCKSMHSECNKRDSDFEIYCYDYNDVNASPVLSSPYLIDLIIYDLEN